MPAAVVDTVFFDPPVRVERYNQEIADRLARGETLLCSVAYQSSIWVTFVHYEDQQSPDSHVES